MQPIKSRTSESGLTLVELTISLAIISVISLGAYQMLVRSQKYTAQKKVTVSTQTEIDQLLAIIKKDWDYRVKTDVRPGVPKTGHQRLTTTDTACGVGTNTFCPKLKLWLQRKINGANVVDVVTIENVCLRPTDNAVRKLIATLNPGAQMDATCSVCPNGDIPSVKIAGLNFDTGAVVLVSENRIFPQNATALDRVKTDGVVGMQACFSQTVNDSPISVDIRAVYRDQSGNGLKSVQKTQVFPFENFASIRLEQ